VVRHRRPFYGGEDVKCYCLAIFTGIERLNGSDRRTFPTGALLGVGHDA